MKKNIISSVLASSILSVMVSTTCIPAVNAEEIEYDSQETVAVVMDVTEEDNSSSHMMTVDTIGKVYLDDAEDMAVEIPVSVGLDIEADGSIVYTLIAKQSLNYTMPVDAVAKFSTDAIDLDISAPSNIMYDYAMLYPSCMDLISAVQFHNPGYFKNQLNRSSINGTYDNPYFAASIIMCKGCIITINDGDVLGTYKINSMVNPLMNVNEIDPELQKSVSISYNNVTLTKEIGDNYDTTDPVVYTKGDVNNDGVINVSDLVSIQQHISFNKDLDNVFAGDVDSSEFINDIDVSLIKEALLK